MGQNLSPFFTWADDVPITELINAPPIKTNVFDVGLRILPLNIALRTRTYEIRPTQAA